MRKKKSKVYYGKDTELAVEEYIKSKDKNEKEKIYLTRIKPSFDKLIENIINMTRFDFKKLDYYSNLHNEVSAHLYSILEKFKPGTLSKKTGKKALSYSYYGTSAKNYLVQLSLKKEDYVSLNSNEFHNPQEGKRGDHTEELVIQQNEDNIYDDELKEFIKILAGHFEKHMKDYDGEKKKIADAIVFFLKNVQNENIYNRKHLYILLREYSGMSSKKITKFLNEFKDDYLKIRKDYYNGNI